MWFWAISAIAGSILGNATDSWFSQTKLGMWFYKKVDDVSTWASKKLGLSSLYRTLNSKGCAENSITQEQRKILSECLLEDRLLFSGLDLNKFSGIKDGLPIVWGLDSNR